MRRPSVLIALCVLACNPPETDETDDSGGGDADVDADTDTDTDTDSDTDTDTDPPLLDNDSDTYTEDVDCNDDDATVYPGAPDTWDDGVDSDCDGSDGPGPAATGLFVSVNSGLDTNPGTMLEPFQTIGHAITQASGGAVIYVANGDYDEGDLQLPDAVGALLGGFEDATWTRDDSAPTTVAPSAAATSVLQTTGTVGPLRIDGFTVENTGGAGLIVNSPDVRASALNVDGSTTALILPGALSATVTLRDAVLNGGLRAISGDDAAEASSLTLREVEATGGQEAVWLEGYSIDFERVDLFAPTAGDTQPVLRSWRGDIRLRDVVGIGIGPAASLAWGSIDVENTSWTSRYGGLSSSPIVGTTRFVNNDVTTEGIYTDAIWWTNHALQASGDTLLVDGNRLDLNGGSAESAHVALYIEQGGGQGAVVTNNVVTASGPGLQTSAFGFTDYFATGVTPAIVVGNTFTTTGSIDQAWAVTYGSDTGLRFLNNIVEYEGDGIVQPSAFYIGSGGDIVFEGNLLSGPDGCAFRPGIINCYHVDSLSDCTQWGFRETACTSAGNNVNADPTYVDWAGGDVHLDPASAGVDQGIDPTAWTSEATVSTDIYGTARPVNGWDIGASEQ